MGIDAKSILELAALILSIVNALVLLRNHFQDRAILVVEPVLPEVYQWWFHLPGGEYEGLPTRKYGFLVYAGIGNRGLRKVGLESWRLFIKVNASRFEQELKPLSIPEPIAEIADFTKSYSVLGQRGVFGTGETVVESGCSISGWVYYNAEYYGDEKWNPQIRDGKIKGTFVVRDIFGGTAKTKIMFSEQQLSYVSKMIPSIEKVK